MPVVQSAPINASSSLLPIPYPTSRRRRSLLREPSGYAIACEDRSLLFAARTLPSASLQAAEEYRCQNARENDGCDVDYDCRRAYEYRGVQVAWLVDVQMGLLGWTGCGFQCMFVEQGEREGIDSARSFRQRQGRGS
jgi:hypothetical protein